MGLKDFSVLSSIELLYVHIFFFFAGNYVLTYLYNQPKLAQFVVQGLVTLFARITNLGWFDSKGTGEYPISMKGNYNIVN